ncbi:MAG: hypothetical protein H6825_16285 [Planctomycetes bacterium]|nr:hypothetical protein [Planctomycetota bacterium]
MDDTPDTSAPRRFGRVALAVRCLRHALLCAGLVSVLGGGCTWRASSGDHECKDLDEDGVCDEGGTVVVIETVLAADDDQPSAGVSGPAPAPVPFDWSDALDAGYDLGDATLDPGAPGEPAVRRVRDVTRVRIVPERDGDPRDARTLERFTRRVREANAALLDLPATAGTLRFDGVVSTAETLCVGWRQLDRAGRPRPAAGQDFLLDHAGRLLRIENELVLDVPPGAAGTTRGETRIDSIVSPR